MGVILIAVVSPVVQESRQADTQEETKNRSLVQMSLCFIAQHQPSKAGGSEMDQGLQGEGTINKLLALGHFFLPLPGRQLLKEAKGNYDE